jgi:hypothetical protein
MKTTTALLCLMITTTAMAEDNQPQTEQTTRPDLVLNQQESIVSTELLVIRLRVPISESEEVDTVLPRLVPPTTPLWNQARANPQIHHPFMLIKKENIKKSP